MPTAGRRWTRSPRSAGKCQRAWTPAAPWARSRTPSKCPPRGWTGRSPSPGTGAGPRAGWSARRSRWRAGPGRAGRAGRGGAPAVHGRVLLAGDTSVMLDIEGDRVEFDYDELGPGQVQVEFGRPGEAGPMPDGAQAKNGGTQDGH